METTASLTRLLFATISSLFLVTSCSDESNPAAPAERDYSPPQIQWIAPDPDSTLSDSVVLQFIVFDSSALRNVSVFRNGIQIFDSTPTSNEEREFSFTWNTLESADGMHILEIRAMDEFGNLGVSPSLLVTVRNEIEENEDRTPPSIEWISPSNDSLLAGEVELIFEVFEEDSLSDLILIKDGIRAVRVEVHDSLKYSSTWNTLEDIDGAHSWEIRAWDVSGNVGHSEILVANVRNRSQPEEDVLGPDLWWESPAGGATVEDTVVLRLRYFDEVGVDSVALYLDGVLSHQSSVVSRQRKRFFSPPRSEESSDRGGFRMTNEGAVEFEWNTPDVEDGVHVWEARGWDAAGNVGQSLALLLRVQNHEPPIVDNTPPIISWLSPTSEDTVEGAVSLRCQVADDVALDSIKVLLNGREWNNLRDSSSFRDFQMTWVTVFEESPLYLDGRYFFEIEATDAAGNFSRSRTLMLNLWNNRPRVLWVPDEFATIQAAINASDDGDTVRVRAGTYEGGVNITRRVWLESEEGPERTIIDAAGFGWGLHVAGVRDTIGTAIRGFEVLNSDWAGIQIDVGASLRISNNIIICSGSSRTIRWREHADYSSISNNVFVGKGLEIYASTGVIHNNVVYQVDNTAFWNSFIYENPVIADYNLVFDYSRRTNDPPIRFGEHNIFDQDPLFTEGTYRLSEQSPAIDSGNPELLDPDGTRSDMGAYGGSHAYR